MTREDLIALRKRLGLNQSEMAEAIGLKIRAYSNIETGDAELRQMHILAAERAAIDIAMERGDPLAIPAHIRSKIAAVYHALNG